MIDFLIAMVVTLLFMFAAIGFMFLCSMFMVSTPVRRRRSIKRRP